MITICVESDEEQWAIGTALVNGAIGFGDWPFAVKRLHRPEPGGYCVGSSGVSTGTGGAGGGGSGGVTAGGGVSVGGGNSAGAGGGGLSVAVPDYRWSLGRVLRTCCATNPAAGHRESCDEDGKP